MPWWHSARNVRAIVLLIVCLGLGLRLLTAHEINETRPDTRARLGGDEPGYDNLARELLAGEPLSWPGRVPLYPAWLAGLHYTTGGSYAREVYIQSLVGALAIWLTFMLGRDCFGPAIGILAAAGAAVDVVLVRQPIHFMSEILFTPLVLAVAISFGRAMRSRALAPFAWTGAWIGVANLVRPTLVAFPIVAAATVAYALGVRRGARPAAVLLFTSSLVVAPWIIRNYLKYDAIYPLATSNAILWQGSPEYYHLVRDRGFGYLDVWNKVIYGPGSEGQEAGSIEGDRYWTRRALRSIGAEPWIYVRFCLEKSVTYWIGDPNADWADTYVFNYHALRQQDLSRWLTVQYMLARAFPLFALAGLFLLRPYWPRLVPILSILAYCTLLHALTHAEARLSEPLHPLLMVIASAAVLCATRSSMCTDDPL